ncbi:OmpP1/FadL family transporter [Palleronia sp. KMU-117]|uniref:OmpP1/FadL family transporter n=1 Tax=Palleronia sp. KMU-117 TaxID=3434108 RepID=UPI003D715D31
MAFRLVATATAVSLCAGTAFAGGIERTNQVVGIIFQEGTYAELSFGYVDPSVSGTATAFSPTPGANSGNMVKAYSLAGAAFRMNINDQLSFGVIFDQPYGADVSYPAGTGYFAQGSTAELDSNALTAVLRYQFAGNYDIYGGLRYQTLSANAFIPFVTPVPGVTPPYQVNGERDGGLGWLIGAAYEVPEIALRVALTYNSSIEHELDTTESSFFGLSNSVTTIETPQSVNLDFQTGIAADTLLFAAVRWVDWSEFDISPEDYGLLTGGASLVSYDSDTTTYVLGLGRRINEQWSVSGRVAYEDPTGGFSSNLGPTDGQTTVALAAQYTVGQTQISGGVSYTDIGDAETTLGGSGLPASDFSGNSAWGAGIRIGYTF